jgi:hypothetical protein
MLESMAGVHVEIIDRYSEMVERKVFPNANLATDYLVKEGFTRSGPGVGKNPCGRGNPMDRETAEHFYAWLEKTVPIQDQHEVEQGIHDLLRDDPELLEGRSWPELRSLAEGKARGNPRRGPRRNIVWGIGKLPPNKVIQYPSGRWGFVGSVDARLSFVRKDGSTPSPKEFQDAQLVGPQMVGLKTRSWGSREEAIEEARRLGLPITNPLTRWESAQMLKWGRADKRKPYKEALADTMMLFGPTASRTSPFEPKHLSMRSIELMRKGPRKHRNPHVYTKDSEEGRYAPTSGTPYGVFVQHQTSKGMLVKMRAWSPSKGHYGLPLKRDVRSVSIIDNPLRDKVRAMLRKEGREHPSLPRKTVLRIVKDHLGRAVGIVKTGLVKKNPHGMKLIGQRLHYVKTTKGTLRSAGRATIYGERDGSVFIRGFFGRLPAGLVTQMEYYDDGKARREGLKPDGRPWRHDFTKERRPLVRVKGGVRIPAGKRPLWGMR